MKGRNILWIAALALGAVLAGCSALPEDVTAPERQEIGFTGSVGTFQVKATDTAFELGDAVGLFASAEIGAYNVRMEWNGQRFIPDEALYWGPANKTYAFAAYYPYDAEVLSSGIQFCVNSDQSTHELYTASDLMIASSLSEKTNADVALEFHHAFSKLVISIDNQLTEAIADVYVSGVYGDAKLDIYDAGRMTLWGTPGSIKAGKVITAAGSEAWAAIVPPQNGTPSVIITTVSGRQYDCLPESNVSFLSGNRYNVKIDLTADMISTDFTSDVTAWTDDKDIMFGTTVWSVIGSWSGWAADLIMAKSPVGLYETYVPVEMGDEFKFRKNQDWTINYGIGEPGSVVMVGEGEYPLTRDGGNITMCEAGTWLVQFDEVAETVTFRKESYEAWPASVDGDDSDWCDLDPNYVFSATCSNGSQYNVIKNMKAFANSDYLYVYFEYDYDSIGWGEDEYVPFHIFIDADNDTNTGWWNRYLWEAPGIDYFLESFLFYEGYGANYHDAGLYKFIGEDCSSEWAWNEFDVSGISVGAINQRTMSAYEVRMSLASLPVGDSFSIGIDIQQEWNSVGLLPNEANGGLLEVNRYYGN